jgi:hypothetical protein
MQAGHVDKRCGAQSRSLRPQLGRLGGLPHDGTSGLGLKGSAAPSVGEGREAILGGMVCQSCRDLRKSRKFRTA